MPERHFSDLRSLIARALQRGAERISGIRWKWDLAGQCQSPKIVELWARPAAWEMRQRERLVGRDPWGDRLSFHQRVPYGIIRDRRVTVRPGKAHTLELEIHTKCRTCGPCLRQRAAHWRLRAVAETAVAVRTWFGTLTLSPAEQFLAVARARQRSQATLQRDYDTCTQAEQFRWRCAVIGEELTKYLKRVRKQSRAPLRYLLVAEAHKSGDPHFHMLVHEVDAGLPVRHKVLSDQWKLGFSKWNLVNDPKQATYLCKYLAKSALARVRASGAYGSDRPIDIGSTVLTSRASVPYTTPNPLTL